MGKIALKLFSGINKIQLNAPIKFNKLRINKLRYITALDYEGVLSIQLQGLNINAYIDANKIYDYFFILFVENTPNRILNFIQLNESYDYNGITQNFNNFTINIYIDGVIDAGITIDNPLLIEFEYI